MKILIKLLGLLLIIGCTDNRQQYNQEYSRVCDSIKVEIDSLKWNNIRHYKGKGSATIDSLTFSNPIRIKYVYNDISNTGFTIYSQANNQLNKEPLVISTESEHNCFYSFLKITNGSLKVVTGGKWAMTIEELGHDYYPNVKTSLIDSCSILHIKDSLITNKMEVDAQNDTIKLYSDLEDETKEWYLIDSRKGVGEFETEWFYLPKCKVKIIAEATAFDISFRGGISLEGKSKSESWYVIPSAWHMSRSPIISEKVFDIPGGQYFFSVDVDEATWQYKIYTYH